MPYSYHKQGDKYVVIKKDTGKEVGRTKGTKEALKKYLAALHINANENKTMKKSELTKMIQEVIKEVLSEQSTKKITEVYVPNNIEEFAKRKGVLPLVKKVATWAEKCGKGIRGGTAIGKNYSTLVLDLRYQDGAIRINLDDQTVNLYGEEVFDVKSFKMALDNNANEMNETDYMNRRKKQDADYTTNKKDAPKKQSKMSMPTGKTDYMKRREAEKKMQEAAPTKDKDGSAAFDTSVAFRLIAKGNRDEAFAELQKDINKNTTDGKFPKVKATIILSKGNPQHIILKLNGPSAFSMGKNTITAKDKTKAYINPVIRNNFSKVEPYTQQLTKI
jgi:hypothetical protein